MAKLFDSLYDPRQLSGTSGAEVSDLRPEQAYDTDLRRIDEEERDYAKDINDDQGRVEKYFRAAKTAGKYKQSASIDEPQIRGKTPRSEANIAGTELPSLGDTYGTVGSTGYARKPQPTFGADF